MVEMRPSECPSLAIHKSLGSIPSHNFKSTIVACTGTPYVFYMEGLMNMMHWIAMCTY